MLFCRMSHVGRMGLRDVCSQLRNRATLKVTMTTLLRNDSWCVCELSDMAYLEWKDPDKETPFQLLNFEVASKVIRDMDKLETATSFCHLDPWFCPQGSTAFYLYLWFFISNEPTTWDFHDNSTWFDTKMNVNIGDKQASAVCYDKVVSKCNYYDNLKKAAKSLNFDFNHWERFGLFYWSWRVRNEESPQVIPCRPWWLGEKNL